MHGSVPVIFALILAMATTATAQTKDPLPRLVIDAQGSFSSLPTSEGWVPSVPVDTPIPGHGFGFAVGGQVHVFTLGLATFGVGGSAIMARKAGQPFTTTAGVARTPAVTTAVTSLNPQVSINFGHRLGWSYLSGGYSSAKVTSASTAFGTVPAATVPELWNPGFNYGGGARWFMKPHLAASFDVRFVQLNSREATAQNPVFALRTKMVNFLVGISIQ